MPVTFNELFPPPTGGTTACVVAGRLIETDPNLKILIVEPGPHIKGIETHVQPARYFSNLASETTLARYVAKPNPALDGRQVVVPTGKCVGGGSAVNCAYAYPNSWPRE